MRAQSGVLKGRNPSMAVTAMAVIAAFLLYGTSLPGHAERTFETISNGIITYFKWYYVGIVAFFLLFCLWLLLSRFGDLKLGDDDHEPEFGYFSWFSMLFGAGMGIGLLFWSIAEPIWHFQSNPFIAEGQTAAAAEMAMRLTSFHWGLHPWAIYAIVGLALAFFSFRKKLPLSIRSVFYPLLGDRIYGPIGHAVDVLAVFGTVFGVATSLGFGVQQMNMGLNQLVGLPIGTSSQIALIGVTTVLATLSVVSGVGRGIRILSELNLWLGFAMLAFFLLWGPTQFLLESLIQGFGDYVQSVVGLSFWTDATGGAEATWQSSWTIFYWGWWIAWAPFVGMFIARISRGRTIREFVLGVLLAPKLLAIFWLTVFGGTGMWLELFGGGGLIEGVAEDDSRALYFAISSIAGNQWVQIVTASLATVLIATYFITSSDSATLVVTTLLSLGDPDPPIAHRITWG